MVRHAHRDKPFGRAADNGLSPKGKKQARRDAKALLKRLTDNDVELVSSPKLRCLETLEPLAARLEKTIDTSPLLLEESEEGEAPNIEERIAKFINDVKRSPASITVACSHGDWIPMALDQLFGIELTLKKGAWAEIEFASGKPKLTWLVQSPV